MTAVETPAAATGRGDAVPVLAAMAVLAGVLAGERLGPGDGRAAAALAALAVVAAVAVRPGRGRAAALGLAAVALLGAASMQRALHGLDGAVAAFAGEQSEAVLRVRLTDDPRWRRSGTRVTGRVESVNGRRHGRGSLVVVHAAGPTAARLRLLSAGDAAVVSGRFRALEGFERRHRWRHVTAAFAAGDLHAVSAPAAPVLRLANALRRLVLRGADPLPSTERALVAGFLVGDDRALPPAVARDFRASGLAHLLAVSGANVALALALVRPALWRAGLTGRLAGGLAAVGVFAAMTRFEPSVLRASAMAGLGLVAGYLGRPATGCRLLALAAAGLLMVDPFLAHSVGFQLSCGASAGIVVLAGPLAARLRGPAWVREALAVTAAAQIGAAPAALPAFGALPLAALPANLLAAPAAAALTMWGLASGLAGGALAGWAPGAPALLSWPTGVLAGYVAGVARLAARLPGAVDGRAVCALAVIVVLALAAGLAVRARIRGCAPTPGPHPATPVPGRG